MAKYFHYDDGNEMIYINLDLVMRIAVQGGIHVTVDFASPEGALRTISISGERNVDALLETLRSLGCDEAA